MYVIVEFLVVGMKYLFLQCFLKEAIMDFWGLQSQISRPAGCPPPSQLVVHIFS